MILHDFDVSLFPSAVIILIYYEENLDESYKTSPIRKGSLGI